MRQQRSHRGREPHGAEWRSGATPWPAPPRPPARTSSKCCSAGSREEREGPEMKPCRHVFPSAACRDGSTNPTALQGTREQSPPAPGSCGAVQHWGRASDCCRNPPLQDRQEREGSISVPKGYKQEKDALHPPKTAACFFFYCGFFFILFFRQN